MANNDYAVAMKQVKCLMGTIPGTFMIQAPINSQ